MYQIYNYLSLFIATVICVKADRGFVKDGNAPAEPAPASSFPVRALRFISTHSTLFLLILFIIFLFSRLFRLSILPAGVHVDEIGVTYDAFSLLHYGTDRFGRAYPVYPTNYGDGNSAMYTYLEMLFLRFFPFSVKTIRLPAFICSILCFFASYGITWEIYKDKLIALLGPIFVTIIPFFMMSERFGLDCNLMLSIVTVALYFLTKAVNSEKPRDYALAGVFFGLTLYTYVLSYLMLPLFIILLTVYFIFIKKFKWKNFLALGLPFALLGFPLLLEQLVNMGMIPEFHFLLSDFMRLPAYRRSEISFSHFISNFPNIIYLLFGGDTLSFNTFQEFGPVYWSIVPLMITGFLSGIRRERSMMKQGRVNLITLFSLYAFSVYFTSLLLTGFNTYNSNGVYIAFAVLAIEGLRCITCDLKSYKLRYAFGTTLLCMLAFSFLLFGEFYFRRQTAVYGIHPVFVSTEPGDIVRYVEAVYDPDKTKHIYTEINYHERDFSDLSIALYTETDPAIWRAYEERKDTVSGLNFMGNIAFDFPADFDENEDAVYILGTDWNHIVSYLISIGYNTDTSFAGYTIVYK